MSRTLAVRLLASLLPFALACGSDPVAASLPPEATVEETTFAPSLGIDLATFTTTAAGVYYKDRVVGTGDSTVALGKTVVVHYIGWLPNGRVFEQTSPDFPPANFTLGAANGPVPGFTDGILGMKVGGSRVIIIPPRLAYGYAGSGPIPGNSVIIFRVDVYGIETPAAE
jgi:FKBP-type peptidyl-prolyl cis-trans isomerase